MTLSKNKTIAGAVVTAVLMLGGVAGQGGLEGWKAKPYQDTGGIWTDCNGNTKDVSPNHIRTKEECNALMKGEANRLGNALYSKITRPVSVKTLASFISFCYNAGQSACEKSTMLRLYNAGQYSQACQQMLRWVYVNKVYSPGLYNRRVVEYRVCSEGLENA